MGSRRDYTINVAIKGDDSGLRPLEKGLKEIDSLAEGLATHRGIKLNANIGGNAIETLRDINGYLDKLDDHTIKVSLGGDAETQLKSIEGHLSKIATNTETKINVGGNAEKELEAIQGIKDKLERPIKVELDVDTKALEGVIEILSATSTEAARITGTLQGGLEGLGISLARGFQSVNNEIGKIQRNLSSLGTGVGSGIGTKLANEFEGAAYNVGKIQTQLNSLRAPTITPQVQMPDMGAYYGGYDQLGHLNMGAIGGSRILSMIGVGAFRNVTYGNASKEQTNEVLLQRMDEGASTRISAKTYEGGTDTITHAVSQNRTVRNPDLISQLYAFQMATGATNEELVSNVFGGPQDAEWGTGSLVDVLAAFGESVALQTGSEQLGTSAMFDLAKAFGGQYASVDQYGVSEETLKAHGYDPKSENVTEFMRAVGEIIHADAPNDLMNTTEGGLTNLRKRFHRAGRQIGQIMMGPIDFLSSQLLKIDKTDFKFAGITIPKGTFSTAIIGITGLVSAIDPLQQTLHAVKDTFNKVTGAIRTAKDGLIGLADKIANLGNLDALRKFKDFGAYGMLSQERYARLHPQEIIESSILGVQNTKGIHDFRDVEIMTSGMTWDQKRRTMNTRKLDSLLYDLEGGMSDEVKRSIEKQAREQSGSMVATRKWAKRAEEKKELSKMERMGAHDYILEEMMADFESGRKNQINELSRFQKLKEGFKLSFDPQTSAFGKAYRKEKDKYKGGGFFNQVKGKTVGNIRGIARGLQSLRSAGGLTSSLQSLGGVFTALIGTINPVTVIMGVLTAGVAALGAIFAIAWANSETFQKKVGELGQKLHDLMDTVVYVVGDMLQASGLTKQGGAGGIVELATQIVDTLKAIVTFVQNILAAITGRNLKQSKKVDSVEPAFKKTLDEIKKQETEKGIGNADKSLYEKAYNQANQLKAVNPTYFTKDKIHNLGIDKDTFVDSTGKTWADTLNTDPDTLKDSQGQPLYNMYRDEMLPALKTEGGIDLEWSKLKETFKNPDGSWNAEAEQEFNKSYADYQLWLDSGGTEGHDWNDTAYVKANSALQDRDLTEEDKQVRDERRNTIGARVIGFLSSIGKLLQIIGVITGAILAIMAAEKGLQLIKAFRNLKGDGVLGKLRSLFAKKFPELNKRLPQIRNPDVRKKGGNILEQIRKGDLWKSIKQKRRNVHDWFGNKDKSFAKKLVNLGRDIEQKGGLTKYIKDSTRVKSILESIKLRLPELTKIANSNLVQSLLGGLKSALGGLGRMLHLTGEGGLFGKILGKLGLGEGGAGIISKILAKLGGKFLAKGFLAAIPVVGEFIAALWMAWDIASWVGDWLDTNIPWAGQLFEAISPLRTIQKHWNDIVGTVTMIGGIIWNGVGGAIQFVWNIIQWVYNLLLQIGSSFTNMGSSIWNFIVSPFQWVYDILQGILQFFTDLINGTVNWGNVLKTVLENIPVIGEIIKIGESLTGTPTGAGQESTNTTGNGVTPTYTSDTRNALNPYYNTGGTMSTVNPVVARPNGMSLAPNSLVNNTSNSQGNTNNVNLTFEGIVDHDDLATKVMRVLNQNLFWDGQKAGRTVDSATPKY